MPFPAQLSFDTGLSNRYVRSGKPVEVALRAHPTIGILYGEPKLNVDSQVGKKIPNVQRGSVEQLDPGAKTLKIPYLLEVNTGSNLTRASMANAPVYTSPDVNDGLQFLTTFYRGPLQMTSDQIMEGRGKNWDPSIPFEEYITKALVIDYYNKCSPAIFATGAGRMPGDGVLGSFRAMISDGLTDVQRGLPGTSNESAYVDFLGASRLTNPQYRSFYTWNNGAAFSLGAGVLMGANLMARGATSVVCPMGPGRWNALMTEVRQNGRYTRNESPASSRIGGYQSFYDEVAQVTYYLEPNLTASTWLLFMDLDSIGAGSDIYSSGVDAVRDRLTTVDTMKFNLDVKHQVAVFAPHRCGLLEGLTTL